MPRLVRLPSAEALRICELGAPRPDLLIHENGAFVLVEAGDYRPPDETAWVPPDADDADWVVVEEHEAAWPRAYPARAA